LATASKVSLTYLKQHSRGVRLLTTDEAERAYAALHASRMLWDIFTSETQRRRFLEEAKAAPGRIQAATERATAFCEAAAAHAASTPELEKAFKAMLEENSEYLKPAQMLRGMNALLALATIGRDAALEVTA
jgi:hypothetical protein